MPRLDVLIYRGTGGVRNKTHPYHDEPALVRAGHVGIAGVIDGDIIGFHPTPEATETIGGTDELIKKLERLEPVPGRLQSDTHYFQRAHELAAETNGRTTVYTYSVEVSDETLAMIQTWYNDEKEALYNFPNHEGQFKNDESNCAFFWKRFNIPLPARTGNLRELTEKMKAEGYETWQPSES